MAAGELDVSASATPIPAAATTAITAKMIPSRFVMGGSFDSGASVREPISAPGLGSLSCHTPMGAEEFTSARSAGRNGYQTLERVGS
jgi:hypothetical protein